MDPTFFQSCDPAIVPSIVMTVVELLREWRAKKHSTAAATIDDYKEWLRRNEHEVIVRMLEANASTLRAVEAILIKGHEMANSDQADLVSNLRRLFEKCLAAFAPDGWLSVTPRSARPYHNIPMIGRQHELTRLTSGTTDQVLVGQPGSGKSYLVEQSVRDVRGCFAFPDGNGSLTAALRAADPTVVVVDDAGVKSDLIQHLKQIRRENADLKYRIVAVGWPSEREFLLDRLNLHDGGAIELERLTRDELVEVVESVGLVGPPALIWTIVTQSSGKPGLAVTLADLALNGGGEDVCTRLWRRTKTDCTRNSTSQRRL